MKQLITAIAVLVFLSAALVAQTPPPLPPGSAGTIETPATWSKSGPAPNLHIKNRNIFQVEAVVLYYKGGNAVGVQFYTFTGNLPGFNSTAGQQVLNIPAGADKAVLTCGFFPNATPSVTVTITP